MVHWAWGSVEDVFPCCIHYCRPPARRPGDVYGHFCKELYSALPVAPPVLRACNEVLAADMAPLWAAGYSRRWDGAVLTLACPLGASAAPLQQYRACLESQPSIGLVGVTAGADAAGNVREHKLYLVPPGSRFAADNLAHALDSGARQAVAGGRALLAVLVAASGTKAPAGTVAAKAEAPQQ